MSGPRAGEVAIIRARLDHWIDAASRQSINSYLVIDATWQSELALSIREGGTGWEPLLGHPDENRQQSHVRSPLIVDLIERSEVVDPWLQEGFAQRLGVVVFSRLALAQVRTKLKRFASVITPEMEKPAYFRFYDARTLGCFLATGFLEQWNDFFSEIELIAAPSDYSAGWSAFRFNDGKLQAGFEPELGADLEWKQLDDGGRQDEHYPAAFPFRRITEPQYSKILACTRHLFHVEIARFIARALPDEIDDVSDDELKKGIERSHAKVESLGYDSEDAVFYWAVLSFLFGHDFDRTPSTASWLATEWLDIEAKLETLVFEVGKAMDNEHLIELADTMETKAEFADGTTAKWRTRSGRRL